MCNDFFKLLNLRFQCKIGPLKVLNILVLGLHRDDLHIKALGVRINWPLWVVGSISDDGVL